MSQGWRSSKDGNRTHNCRAQYRARCGQRRARLAPDPVVPPLRRNFRLLGVDQARSKFPDPHHHLCRLLPGRSSSVNGFSFALLISTLLGTLLVASGTAALNQFIERRFDAQMRRTARRPLAAGKLNPAGALCFGILLSATGAFYLAVAVNPLASLLAVMTLASYLFIYTPLKRKTPFYVLIGAFPGAMPPLIGWAAARGRLDAEAWVLFAMVFLWQFPHFMAIAWMYREDYSQAGYLVLPKGESQGNFRLLAKLHFFFIAHTPKFVPGDRRRIGPRLFSRRSTIRRHLLLLCRPLCFLQIECRGPAVAVRFNRLSPRCFYSDDVR